MKTLLRLVLALAVLVLSCRENNSGEKNPSSKKRMKDLFREAHVETQTTISFDYNGGQKEEKGYCSGVVRFDTFGNVLEMKAWNKAGELKMVRTRGYDEKGNEKWLQDSLPGDLSSSYREEYFTDASGKTVKAVRYSLLDHKLILTTAYTYEEEGTCIRRDKDSAGKDLEWRKYQYDAAGNVIRFESFEAGKKEPDYIQVTNYDERGAMVSNSEYFGDHKAPDSNSSYSCNEFLLPASTRRYDKNRNVLWESQITYTYRK